MVVTSPLFPALQALLQCGEARGLCPCRYYLLVHVQGRFLVRYIGPRIAEREEMVAKKSICLLNSGERSYHNHQIVFSLLVLWV